MGEPPKSVRHLIFLALASSAFSLLFWHYPSLVINAGIGPVQPWFMDTHTLLGSMEASWRGLDVYSYNAITMPHWYSHWWFVFDWAHPTQGATYWLGSLISLSALVGAWLVLRPRSASEMGWSLLVLCSAPFILGLYRANADLLLFTLLSLCIPLLTSSARVWRIAGAPVLIALATGLKYYPGTAGLILLAVRPGRDRNLAVSLGVILLGLTVLSVAPDLVHYANDESVGGFYTFGARGLFQLFDAPSALFIPGAAVILGLAGWAVLRCTGLNTWSPPPELRREYLAFIMGATILTGCFMVTANYAYRWIFLVGMMPFLCRLDVARTHPALDQLRKITRLLIACVLWIELLVIMTLNLTGPAQDVVNRWEQWTTGFMQVITWMLFTCMSGWLVHFVTAQLRAWLRPTPAETSVSV